MTISGLLTLADQPLETIGSIPLTYTESQGDPDLRQKIADTHTQATADDIVILNAPEEGIFITLHALLEPTDEVIVLTPAYDSLLNLAQHLTPHVKKWEIKPTETGWQIDLDQLQSLITAETKLIVVNFPHNPTGFLPTDEQLETIAEIARTHGIWLFCDEMYRGLELNRPEPLPSAVDLYEKAIILSGLSKSYGLPGLRVGWLAVRDEKLRNEIINWKFYTTICPPSPTEYLAKVALDVRETIWQKNQDLIKGNIKIVEPFMAKHNDMFRWRPPVAGSIALIETPYPDTMVFTEKLVKEAGVMLLPGKCLGAGEQYVRFGLGRDNFSESLNILDQYLTENN